MPDPTQQQIADQLLSGNFTKSGPVVTQLSDPLVDTPMVVTIDQLKPYDLNPRIVKNPLFDDIKASIRERGLDAPPAITRRPGETHYIIRNGGNTRLKILHELWTETQNERFYKINCLFRPWQGEIVALTGHLAENELHGQLTYIERALAVVKIYEIYRQDLNVDLNQKQLSQKLTAEGYPISEAQVSRMRETVETLLPIIPNSLYSGLSRTQIDRLLRLRKICKLTWSKHEALATEEIKLQFNEVFSDVLTCFDGQTNDIDIKRLKDELIGRMSKILGAAYDRIAYDISEREARQRMVESPPTTPTELDEELLFGHAGKNNRNKELNDEDILTIPLQPVIKEPAVKITRTKLDEIKKQDNDQDEETPSSDEHNSEDEQALLDAHILSPDETTPRLDAIEGMLDSLTEETTQNFKTNVLQSIPVQAGGLYAISDIWYINPHLDNLAQLRTHIGQLVLEIADEWGLAECIETTDTDLGFQYKESSQLASSTSAQFLAAFLQGMASPTEPYQFRSDYQNALLTGYTAEQDMLSDVAFVKLMRIYRLIRRFWQLQRFQ